LVHTVANQAFMLATNDVLWISGWVFVALIGVIWIARRPQRATG
jgi:DHA2 family multidrug resistance protein